MNTLTGTIQHTPLGEILIRRGQLRKYQLEFILKLQEMHKRIFKPAALGELLIKHRAVTALALTEALAVQEEMPRESVTEVAKRLEAETSYQTKAL